VSVPPTILGLIRKVNGLPLPGILAEGGEVCEGAKHHSPRPLIVHEFEVLRDGLRPIETIEDDVPGAVWLCATCADNVRVALSLFASHGGALPWEARREFGNLVRAIAQRPYEEQPA
jgi:hypothetical protein